MPQAPLPDVPLRAQCLGGVHDCPVARIVWRAVRGTGLWDPGVVLVLEWPSSRRIQEAATHLAYKYFTLRWMLEWCDWLPWSYSELLEAPILRSLALWVLTQRLLRDLLIGHVLIFSNACAALVPGLRFVHNLFLFHVRPIVEQSGHAMDQQLNRSQSNAEALQVVRNIADASPRRSTCSSEDIHGSRSPLMSNMNLMRSPTLSDSYQ